jgi:hypothetical protein
MACADVIVSCVDNDEARAFLATESRFLGKPLVEVGFRGPQTNLAVYPNLDADEPCFLCHSPDASPTSVSCRLFAAEQEQIGMAPAIQPAAAIVGGLALEAAIMALHHEFPLGSKQLFFDIRQGRFSSARLTTSPRCPGPHRLWSQPAKLDVTTHDTVRVLLEAVSRLVRNPVLLLHSPYILRAACPTCGRSMDVRRLAWNLKSFPPCGKCTREYTQTAEPPLEVYSRVSFEDEELVGMSCSELGLHPLTVIEVSSLRSEELMIVQLAGDIEDLFPLNIAGNRHSSDDS